MKYSLVVVCVLLMLMNMCSAVLLKDDENRIYKGLHNLPMRCGGGWPSTNDNPSGGGRWNN